MLENVGASLIKVRRDMSMTVDKLAEVTGFSQRTIYRYEQNVQLPSLLFVVELAMLKGCSIESIIGISTSNN